MVANACGSRMTRQRVLCLLPFIPHLDGRHGGSRAVAQTVLALASRYDVGVIAVRSRGEPPVDPRVKDACVFLEEIHRDAIPLLRRLAREAHALTAGGDPAWVTRWRVPAVESRARALIDEWRPDIIQIEYHVMAQFANALRAARIPIALTHYEAATPAAHERATHVVGSDRMLAMNEARAWDAYERRVFGQVDAIIAVSERDRDAIAAMTNGAPVQYVPLAAHIPERPLSATGRREGRVVFVGNFIHPPNIDAAEWLNSELHPAVRARVPDATLHLVGPNLPAALAARAGPGITITGEVEDLAWELDNAAVVVAPMRLGGGARVKVLDALAAGKAIVTTSRGIEGIDVEPGTHLLVADETASFADAVVTLLNDSARRVALGAAARAWAERNGGQERVAQAYGSIYDSLLSRS